MQKNLYKIKDEDEEKKLKKAVESVNDIDISHFVKNLGKIWAFVLFAICISLFTIITSIKLALYLWH